MVPFRQLAQENRDLLHIYESLGQFLMPQPMVNFLDDGHMLGPSPVGMQLEQANTQLNPIFR